MAYAAVFSLLVLIVWREEPSLEVPVLLVCSALWVTGMWFVWGRNYLIADVNGIRSRNYFTRYEFSWGEIDGVFWSDDVVRQESRVHVWLNDAHPIEDARTICTIAPIGLLLERKRLAKSFCGCCRANGVTAESG